MYVRKRARERESRENSRIGIIDKARRDDEFELCWDLNYGANRVHATLNRSIISVEIIEN